MTPEPEGWQLEGASPELYERYLVPAVTRPWAVDLVDRLGVGRGDHVLDVACGTGVVARVAAERVGGGGRVAGLDINRPMLAVAGSLGRDAGVLVEWFEGSADALPFTEGEFGVVSCQLGLQFFPNRPEALREMGRVLAPRGRLGVSVFAAIERNPATHALADALDRYLGADASRAKRSEHSLGDTADLSALLAGAGFADARVETITRTVSFASAAEYVRIQFAATPLAASLAQHEPRARARLLELVSEDVDARLAPFSRDGRLTFPQEVHVALSRA